MTEPLKPDEVEKLLKPNPKAWGEDGYPAGFTICGLPVIAEPGMKIGDLRLQLFDDDGDDVPTL